jgi:hypothetical protein
LGQSLVATGEKSLPEFRTEALFERVNTGRGLLRNAIYGPQFNHFYALMPSDFSPPHPAGKEEFRMPADDELQEKELYFMMNAGYAFSMGFRPYPSVN